MTKKRRLILQTSHSFVSFAFANFFFSFLIIIAFVIFIIKNPFLINEILLHQQYLQQVLLLRKWVIISFVSLRFSLSFHSFIFLRFVTKIEISHFQFKKPFFFFFCLRMVAQIFMFNARHTTFSFPFISFVYSSLFFTLFLFFISTSNLILP